MSISISQALLSHVSLALADAKALHAVAEERGHRDAAVLDLLGVAKVADGLADMPEQPSGSQKPGLRPSDEPSARSISSSRADEVATDERATDTGTKDEGCARRNDERVGDRSRSRTDRATAVSDRIFGIQSNSEDLQTDIRQPKAAWLSCRFSFSCIEKNMYAR